MLTWQELTARATPCSRCGSRFRIAGPLDEPALAEIRAFVGSGRPLDAIGVIRDCAKASLADAKGIYEHVTLTVGECRECKASLSGEVLSDCARCGALNIDAKPSVVESRPPHGSKQHHYDVEAEVRFLSTEEGGRRKAALSGYRPAHLVLPDYLTTGIHHYVDRESVQPGETVRAFITFITPEAYPRSLWPGKVVRVQEASKLVAHARILQVLNPVLLNADEKHD